MEPRLKPIPAFYCVYLLRSTVRHSSLYIGSTPNPTRRLAQHNGKVKGGAVRTSRLSLRPWEMVCIVAGFSSNIAALQFEWAWHNAHLTRHISSDDRISQATTRVKVDRRTGKTRKKVGRPRTGLTEKLSNLHLLLRANYFGKWPLEVRFFNEDVFRSWTLWTERAEEQISQDIMVVLDLAKTPEDDGEISSAQRPAKRRKADLIGNGGIEGVDPTYARFQEPLQKLKDLTDDKSFKAVCDMCDEIIHVEKDLFNICLARGCESLTHMSCLSKKFLDEDESSPLVPTTGICPSCDTQLKWSELMCALSLRIRGQKEVNKLLKKRNRGAAAVAAELLEDEDSSDSEGEEDTEPVKVGGLVDVNADSDEDEVASIASMEPVEPLPQKLPRLLAGGIDPQMFSIGVVIGDSEEER
ncbi:Slx4p interacting protein [Neophaeococcomyces mojaviensis]|uniref:Slx4p interacting protein n=1 Tax=Neophaeococcomyces mojaviensis TaxID=3383035 RepID=A0ACC3AG84_9EURO|nr:Slx4p interacting protein [Knufia sp. JES_112]